MTQEGGEVRLKGTVKWFDESRRFGFITPDGGGEALYVHQRRVKSVGSRFLCEGEAVEFSVADAADGRSKAVDVTAPGGEPLS